MNAEADDHAGHAETQPAKTIAEEREVLASQRDHCLGKTSVADDGGTSIEHIEESWNQGKTGGDPENQGVAIDEG